MANNKQPRLNDAFYGPSIPPPHHRYHHHGSTSCCCLLSIVWKLLLAIITVVVLAFLIFLLIVQPRPFKFYVNEAKLTQFNYTSNNTLHYNLVLNFTAHNPNKKLSIYYDKVEGNAFFEGLRFSTIDVINRKNSFRQYTKSTDHMSGVFLGQQVMVLDQGQLFKFDQDKRGGAFHIYVKLYFTIRFRLGDVIGSISKAKAKCDLKVPLSGSYDEELVSIFQPIKCDVEF